MTTEATRARHRVLDAELAWASLRFLSELNGRTLVDAIGIEVGGYGEGPLSLVAFGRGSLNVRVGDGVGWTCQGEVSPEAATLLDIYLPLCVGEGALDFAVGHVGQSLDGFIATKNGDSQSVTGPENIKHLHRMRALSDAVLVGRSTVECDNPQLTTRLVDGEHAVRVVIDPHGRLENARRLFSDGETRTLVVCTANGARAVPQTSSVETLVVPETNGRICPKRLRDDLRRIGLRRLFVEGGGITVSRFLESGALDRLHIAVAPIFLGGGRRGLSVAPASSVSEAWEASCRQFRLGRDVLYDFDLLAVPSSRPR